MTTALTAPWKQISPWVSDGPGPSTSGAELSFVPCSPLSLLRNSHRKPVLKQARSFIRRQSEGFALLILQFSLRALPCGLLGLFAQEVHQFPSPKAVAPAVSFCACIVVAIGYGKLHGGNNFFFDWRGLALGVAVYFIWSLWLQTKSDLSFAIRVFALYAAVRILAVYVQYLAGYRDILLGVSIPVFDGPALSCIVFAGLLAFFFSTRRREACWPASMVRLGLGWQAVASAKFDCDFARLGNRGRRSKDVVLQPASESGRAQDDTNFSADNV